MTRFIPSQNAASPHIVSAVGISFEIPLRRDIFEFAPDEEGERMHEMRLCGVPVGQTARVSRLEAGPGIRRRLLDIGLTEGAAATCLFASPSGDPRAYLVRGAIIALRDEDARTVCVGRAGE